MGVRAYRVYRIKETIFLLLLLPNSGHGQQIQDGTYIGFNGGLIPKYAILTVNQDSIELEIFTKWQGAWLPCIGTWDENYEPQHLERITATKLENSNITVELKLTKTSNLKTIARNTLVGRVRFNLTPVNELPDRYVAVRNKALSFTERQ
ncbi:MAG: hypothetical protein RIE55_00430 [Marinoscillum sp.]